MPRLSHEPWLRNQPKTISVHLPQLNLSLISAGHRLSLAFHWRQHFRNNHIAINVKMKTLLGTQSRKGNIHCRQRYAMIIHMISVVVHKVFTITSQSLPTRAQEPMPDCLHDLVDNIIQSSEFETHNPVSRSVPTTAKPGGSPCPISR